MDITLPDNYDGPVYWISERELADLDVILYQIASGNTRIKREERFALRDKLAAVIDELRHPDHLIAENASEFPEA